MERHIGLDAHRTSCTFAVIGPSGRKIRHDVVETNGAALVRYLKSLSGRKHLCLEEGTQSAWLYEILSPHVDEIVVTGISRSRGQKSDALDAFLRAEELRTNSIQTPVFKAPRQFSRLRELARVHSMLVRDLVRVQGRLKAMYRSRGVSTPGKSVYSPRERQTDMLAEARKHPIAKILATAPGLGPIRVAQLLPIVVTPHRFRTRRQFWSYCGLGIVMRSSSDWVRTEGGGWTKAMVQQTRGLNRNHVSRLKDIFKGAALTVVMQLPNDPLHEHYQRLLAAGTKPNLAKLTVARRVAAIVLRMWKDEKEYEPETIRKQPQDVASPAH